MWTVGHEFDQAIKHQNLTSSGGCYIANLTLRFAPDLESSDVTFTSAVTNPDAAHYVQFVESGVREFVSRRKAAGKPVGYLRVTLMAITIHVVDAKEWRFKQAACMAMEAAFQAAEMEL